MTSYRAFSNKGLKTASVILFFQVRHWNMPTTESVYVHRWYCHGKHRWGFLNTCLFVHLDAWIHLRAGILICSLYKKKCATSIGLYPTQVSGDAEWIFVWGSSLSCPEPYLFSFQESDTAHLHIISSCLIWIIIWMNFSLLVLWSSWGNSLQSSTTFHLK